MSILFRTHAPPEFAALTLRDLARQAHIAENTEDDILLIQVQDELHRREAPMHIFMEFYRDLWRTEFKPK